MSRHEVVVGPNFRMLYQVQSSSAHLSGLCFVHDENGVERCYLLSGKEVVAESGRSLAEHGDLISGANGRS